MGIAVFLAAFGVALAAVVVQVSREVPSTLTRESYQTKSWDCTGTKKAGYQ